MEFPFFLSQTWLFPFTLKQSHQENAAPCLCRTGVSCSQNEAFPWSHVDCFLNWHQAVPTLCCHECGCSSSSSQLPLLQTHKNTHNLAPCWDIGIYHKYTTSSSVSSRSVLGVFTSESTVTIHHSGLHICYSHWLIQPTTLIQGFYIMENYSTGSAYS